MTAVHPISPGAASPPQPGGTGGSRPSRTILGLPLAAATSAVVAATWTFFGSHVLTGPAVMNGSARGTALVVLVVAVPVLLVSLLGGHQGSHRAPLASLAALTYLLYNSLLLLFLSPFNHAFLAYVAMMSTALWSIVAVLHGLDIEGVGLRFARRAPVRAVAVFVWLVVALNTSAWLRVIAPALTQPYPPNFTAGTGVTTNAIYIQDLGIWLPLMAVAAVWLWRRTAWGLVVVSSMLGTWAIESLGIGVDQWFGHRAEPASDIASGAALVPFLVGAIVVLLTAWSLLRGFDDTTVAVTPALDQPGLG